MVAEFQQGNLSDYGLGKPNIERIADALEGILAIQQRAERTMATERMKELSLDLRKASDNLKEWQDRQARFPEGNHAFMVENYTVVRDRAQTRLAEFMSEYRDALRPGEGWGQEAAK